MKTATLIIAILSLLIISCGGSEPEQVEKQPSPLVPTFKVTNLWQSECKQDTYALDGATGDGAAIQVELTGDTVKISHLDAEYNCAARVTMTASLAGTKIQVQEVIENPEESADCYCNYDLSAEVQGLAAGTYDVEVTDASGQLVGQQQVIVVGSLQITVSETSQSDCMGMVDSAPGIEVNADGDSLEITHMLAEYNCAAELKMEATLVGDEILVQETLLNPHEVVDCICPFNISVKVSGLAAGTYTVKVFSDGGRLAGEVQAIVPDPAGFAFEPSLQSVCKGKGIGSNNGAPQGVVTAVAVGQDAAIITHEDAEYNCATELKLEATLTGSEIVVSEVITNPGVIANCGVCAYDLSVTVRGLAPGTYTVMVYDAEMQFAGETTLIIP